MRLLHRLRTRASGLLGRAVLLWFVLSLGGAAASQLMNPQSLERVCSSAGIATALIQTGDGPIKINATHFDCPMCALTGAPPPVASALPPSQPQPLGQALQPIPAARIATATAAPLPARGPPAR
jgi:hypothetical protein